MPADVRPAGRALTICFVGTFPWETNLRRDVHRLFDALAPRGHRLVYVDPAVGPGQAAPAATRAAAHSPAVTLLTPRAAPGRSTAAGRTLNRRVEGASVRKLWRGAGLPAPDVVIVHPPHRTFLWDAFPGALRVWRNYDFVPPADGAACAARADVVLTSSPRYARLGAFPPEKTHLLPNACDDLRHLAERRLSSPPAARPAAGTMGTFAATTDLPLLQEAVRRTGSVAFRFQGLFDEGTRGALEGLGDVEMTAAPGSDPAAVEAFLASIQAGLCPYARTEWLSYAAPSRLAAFLAAGLPVVSTDFSPDALEGVRDLPGVYVAPTAEAFAAAIPLAVRASSDPGVVRGLVAAAEPHLAGRVAERFERIVYAALDARP